jgi:hypothetical protein
MNEMKCENCKWSKRQGKAIECHNQYPKMKMGVDCLIPLWPHVKADDFCSEWGAKING